MNPQLRQALKVAVDWRRRMIVRAEDELEPVRRCSGCGRETEDGGVTEGCRRCHNRLEGRRKRQRREAVAA